jgi:hypothetical protein
MDNTEKAALFVMKLHSSDARFHSGCGWRGRYFPLRFAHINNFRFPRFWADIQPKPTLPVNPL